MTHLTKKLLAILCAPAAGVIAALGHDGWGWFLLAAVFIA